MSKIKQAIGIMLFESDEFGGQKIVGGGICPTQRANKTCCGVIEVTEMEIKLLGNLFGDDKGTGFAGNVWDKEHLSPTLNTMQGGCKQPMIIEANSIRMVRTEDGKALRKKYENHEIHHGFNEHREPELRKDGVTNTLSTVQKDNYICVAMSGRNPTNPSDRTPGIELEQTLEVNQNGTSNCLTSVKKDNLVMENLIIGGEQKHQSVKKDGICTCLTSSMGTGGGYVPMIPETVRIKQATSQGYIECDVGGVADLSFQDSNTRRGRVQENGQVSPTLMAGEQDICRIENVYDFYNDKMKQDGVCGTLTTGTSHNGSGTFGVVETINKVGQISNDGSQYGTVISDNGLSPNLVAGTHGYANSCIATQYRIRKLTPRECWRLMDFSDEDFEKAEEVNSNTQLYKQAGNSIVTDCLKAIFRQMNIKGVDKWNG